MFPHFKTNLTALGRIMLHHQTQPTYNEAAACIIIIIITGLYQKLTYATYDKNE